MHPVLGVRLAPAAAAVVAVAERENLGCAAAAPITPASLLIGGAERQHNPPPQDASKVASDLWDVLLQLLEASLPLSEDLHLGHSVLAQETCPGHGAAARQG